MDKFKFVFTCGHEKEYTIEEVNKNRGEVERISTYVGEAYACLSMRCEPCAKKFTVNGENTNPLMKPVQITSAERAQLEREMAIIGMPWVKFLPE
jgi:hypothetical protein